MPKINKNTITFDYDDFKELNIQTSASEALKGSGMAYASRVNPFRKIGFISPGQKPLTITNYDAASDLLTKGVVYDNKAYFVTQGDEIHEINVLTETMTTPADHTITAGGTHSAHGSFTGSDIVLYKHNIGGTPTLSAFYSWNDDTDGDIGKFDLSSAYDDDWMSTTAGSGAVLTNGSSGNFAPHPLIVGDDDILYIGDDNVVNQYDGATGTNGTYTTNVYVLPTKYRIVKFLKFQEKLVVYAYDKNSGLSYTSGEVTAFFFNYFDPDPVYYKDLHDNYISEAISANGTMYAFTQGGPTDYLSSKTAKLQVFNGAEFEVLTSFSGNTPLDGGADVRGDMITWISRGSGLVYSWGSPLKGVKAGLNTLSAGSGVLGGALKTLGGSFVLISSKSGGGTVYTENMEQSNYSTSGIIHTCIAEPLFNENQYGKIEKVRIEFGKTTTAGQRLTLTIKDTAGNSADVVDSTNALENVTSADMIKEYFKDTSDANFFNFKDLKLHMTWYNDGDADYSDAQEISRIVIYFDTINL